MTLQEFLDVTADVPDARLRPAMVAALSIEPARSPGACRRFYDRVVRVLRLDVNDDASHIRAIVSRYSTTS